MSQSLRYFGTDGIRGANGTPPMTDTFITLFAKAIIAYLKEAYPKTDLLITIGKDTRASGCLFETVLSQTLSQYGVQVLQLGVVPTPVCAFITEKMQADLGIMITASHNPASDNGIKIFDKHGLKLTEKEELKIEKYIHHPTDFHATKGQILQYEDALIEYISMIKKHFDPFFLKKIKIVLDTANGATYQVAPVVFKQFGAQLVLTGNEPDGHNINLDVGSEYPATMQKLLLSHKASIGIAYDGDGDRVVFCDENGNIADGDQIIGLLAIHLNKSEKLHNKKIAITIHSNTGLDNSLNAYGISTLRTQVGDRHISHSLLENSLSLGGESSGHIIFQDILKTGDGLLASLKVLEIILKTGQSLSSLTQAISLYPKKTNSILIKEKLPLDSLSLLKKTIADVQEKLGTKGRVLVRYSGTENKIRLLIEGPDALIQESMDALVQAVQKELL